MIKPITNDVGRRVTYREFDGSFEHGIITSFNDHCVFVQYKLGCTSQATSREDLEWGWVGYASKSQVAEGEF